MTAPGDDEAVAKVAARDEGRQLAGHEARQAAARLLDALHEGGQVVTNERQCVAGLGLAWSIGPPVTGAHWTEAVPASRQRAPLAITRT